MVPFPPGVPKRVVVEEHHGLCADGVTILLDVVRVCVVSPVLLDPAVLGASDEVSTIAKEIVDPRLR